MESKEAILKGVNKLVNTVKTTLGTKGRTVLFKDDNNKPHITKDGVTVAKHIWDKDDFVNMVITVLREASMKTMMSSGDGTTTTMILAQEILKRGLELIDDKMSYYELSKQIDLALADIIEEVESQSIDVFQNPSLLREIAAISSNDEEVGDYIYEIINDIGLYGNIQVKASHYSETKVDKTKGMKLHKGWFESFMVNNKKEMIFEAQDCNILIVDGMLQSPDDITQYQKYLKGAPLVVFCDDVSNMTLMAIERFLSSTKSDLCIVENDGFGDRKDILMNDLAAITGAYIIDPKDPFNPDNLGKAKTIKVEELYTSVIEHADYSDTELIEELIEEIHEHLDDDFENDELLLSNVDRKFLKKRLANLTGGVAVIYAGGRTEMEMKELKDRLDDAVLAVSAAIRQGVNIGGGFTFLNTQKTLRNKNKDRGYQIMVNALSAPFKQLLSNADLSTQYEEYSNKILKGKALDLRTNKFYKSTDDAYKVYDPTLVLIDALTNATAVAKSLLSVKDMMYESEILN